MNDKEKVRILYDKMTEINYNLQSVNSNINNLRDTLEDSFVIDDKVVEKDNIDYQNSRVVDVKNSVNGPVLDYLRSNCY